MQKSDRNLHVCEINVLIGWGLQTFNKVAAAPPNNNTGDSAICAFFTAVTVLVKPEMVNKLCQVKIYIIVFTYKWNGFHSLEDLEG